MTSSADDYRKWRENIVVAVARGCQSAIAPPPPSFSLSIFVIAIEPQAVTCSECVYDNVRYALDS